MLLERDGFRIEKTPTNDVHIDFLRKLKTVKGLSVNSNLYSKKEEQDSSDNAIDQSQIEKLADDSPST